MEATSGQADCTMLTHWGGFTSLTVRAGLGSRYFTSFMVGTSSRSAARCSSAATFAMSYCGEIVC